MKEQELLKDLIEGIHSANRYISEDLEAICDDTMREYAESTLADTEKAISASKELKAIINNKDLFLDALADIAMQAGFHNIHFECSKKRSITLRAWAKEFADKYANADWEQMDYIILVGEFASEKIVRYISENPQPKEEKTYKVTYVFSTEAVREYEQAVDEGKKWDGSDYEDTDMLVTQEFDTEAELDAYIKGVNAATGYLESSQVMSDAEWEKYLKEYEGDFGE